MLSSVCLVVDALLIVSICYLSFSGQHGHLRGSMLNPLMLIGVLFGIVAADFIAALQVGGSSGYARLGSALVGYDSIQTALVVFTVQIFFFMGGVFGGFLPRVGRIGGADVGTDGVISLDSSHFGRFASAIVLFVFLVLAAGGVFVLFVSSEASVGTILASRQLVFAENRYVQVVLTILLPAFVIFLAYHIRSGRMVMGWSLVVAFFLFFIGSRNIMLTAGYSLILVFHFRGKRFSGLLAPVAVVAILGLGVVYRYFYREGQNYESFDMYVQSAGGIFPLLFESTEIAFAEALGVVVSYGDWDRRWFDGVLGLILYPIPRDLVDFKPLPSSSYFTSVVDPSRWETSRSEMLLGAFGDSLIHYGIVGSCIFFVVFGFGMSWGLRAVVCMSSLRQGFLLPFVVWFSIVLIRADLVNVGAGLWCTALVIFLVFLVARSLKLFVQAIGLGKSRVV